LAWIWPELKVIHSFGLSNASFLEGKAAALDNWTPFVSGDWGDGFVAKYGF